MLNPDDYPVFGIKSNHSHPLWSEYINWLNRFDDEPDFEGDGVECYYGISNQHEGNFTENSCSSERFDHNIITLEEWAREYSTNYNEEKILTFLNKYKNELQS